MSFFTCCFIGQRRKTPLPSSYIDADIPSLEEKRRIRTLNTPLIPSRPSSLPRVRTPPLCQHPALRNGPNASIRAVSPSRDKPHPTPPELAHTYGVTPAQRETQIKSRLRLKDSAESLFDWDTPCAVMVPAGHKLVLSKSKNHLRHVSRRPGSPLNGFRPELVSIGEVVERGGKGEFLSCG